MNQPNIYRFVRNLSKNGIPFLSHKIKREPPKDRLSVSKYYLVFTVDTWAAKKAFKELNIAYALYDSKKRGTAEIAFSFN